MTALLTMSGAQCLELQKDWHVWPIPQGAPTPLDQAPPADALCVPQAIHLQLALFPDQPYWGERLRRINEQAWIYRQEFDTPGSGYRRARLVCEGIDYYAAIWLNGRFVGQHEGHFAPFSFDVTNLLRRGMSNELVIRVSAPWDAPVKGGTYPMDHVLRGMVKGLYEHGEGLIPPNINPIGIWRPVSFVFDSGVSVDRIHVQADLTGRVNAVCTLTNGTNTPWEGALTIDIAAENHDGPGASLQVPVKLTPGQQPFTQTLQLREPHLWWPWDHGDPALYRIRAVLSNERSESTCTDVFGVRSVTLERTPNNLQYRVNGRPVFVRGSSYMPGIYLSACTRESIAQDLQLARDANLNLVRVHVHVSPPAVYELCDRAGLMVWQDFELNWMHDASPEFEARALAMQKDMIDLLFNHPSIVTWACHNEPTMVFTRRENLEQRPAPALYEAARQQDRSRPVFLCSGQMDHDWERSGDTHCYYGALWSRRYVDIRKRRIMLGTEFGFEAPATLETLKAYPEAWERLSHLESHVNSLGDYQAELTQYFIEVMRRQRAETCGGYIHFWLNDLVPQVGCGVLDVHRRPKGGYAALQRASLPLLVALEHDGQYPLAYWVFNDTLQAYDDAWLRCRVFGETGNVLHEERLRCNVSANVSRQVGRARWPVPPTACQRVALALTTLDSRTIAENSYEHPFQPTPRPRGYPWKFDPELGCKVFDRPDALSLADIGVTGITKLIPLTWREAIAEWTVRQQLPPWVVSLVSRLARTLGSLRP